MATAKLRSKIRLTNFRNSCRLSRRFSWSCLGCFRMMHLNLESDFKFLLWSVSTFIMLVGPPYSRVIHKNNSHYQMHVTKLHCHRMFLTFPPATRPPVLPPSVCNDVALICPGMPYIYMYIYISNDQHPQYPWNLEQPPKGWTRNLLSLICH